MSNILYVIDAYLTSKEKCLVIIDLINQIKLLDSRRKIMVINKNSESFGVDKMVDYYVEYLDGFEVTSPPKHFIDSEEYEAPYVFYKTDSFIVENWLPSDGFNNHVANVYNGFILASKEAQKIGFDKVFRIEYDMLFNEDEFNSILNDINEFETNDYLFYGKREGKQNNFNQWAKDYQTAIDLHFCGFSSKLLNGFDFIKNEQEFWDLCNKIRYVGKWTEYLMSMVFEYNGLKNFKGKTYYESSREKYPKSKFDRFSSTDVFFKRWSEIPKICKVDSNRIGIVYINLDYDKVEVEVISNKDYYKKIELNLNWWHYDIIEKKSDMVFMYTMKYDNKTETHVIHLNDESWVKEGGKNPKLNCRLILL